MSAASCSKKTNGALLSVGGIPEGSKAAPLYFPSSPPALPSALVRVSPHKWLGLRWSISGTWMHHTMVTVAACSSVVDMLCSRLRSSPVPLAIALILFDLKVESTLRFGRWLWALSPESLSCLEVV